MRAGDFAFHLPADDEFGVVVLDGVQEAELAVLRAHVADVSMPNLIGSIRANALPRGRFVRDTLRAVPFDADQPIGRGGAHADFAIANALGPKRGRGPMFAARDVETRLEAIALLLAGLVWDAAHTFLNGT